MTIEATASAAENELPTGGVLTVRLDHRTANGSTLRRLSLESSPVPWPWRRRAVSYEFPGRVLPEPETLDAAVFGSMMIAARAGATLRVEGPVTTQALRSARAFMEAWACMRPNRFQVVDVEPDTVVTDSPPPADEAVGAFSGGLDSTFLALRHRLKLLGPASYPITAVAMFQGYDVHWRDQAGFDGLRRRTAPLLESLGLETFVIRTDGMEPPFNKVQHYSATQGAQLGGLLHQLSHRFGYGMLGSTYAYDHPINAWPSSPTTDGLLVGGRMRLIHEGAGFCRSGKAALVAQHPLALKSVKVCHAGERKDRNCGVCDKCVRTQLNFLAAGVKDPPCFDRPFAATPERIDEVLDHLGWGGLLNLGDYTRRHGRTGDWVDAIHAAIKRRRGVPPKGHHSAPDL